MRAVIVILAVAGCDRVFGIHAPDAALGVFTTPALVQTTMATAGSEYVTDPTLPGDESQLGFVWRDDAVPDSADIYLTTAMATPDPLMWTNPTLQAEFSLAARDELNPKLSFDGMVIWFGTPNEAPDVRAFRHMAGGPWQNVTVTEAMGLTSDPTRPGNTTPDGRHMVVYKLIGPGAIIVEYARFAWGEAWSALEGTMDEVNTCGSVVANPHLFAGGRGLVFTCSQGPGTNHDLYISWRPALGMAFSQGIPITEVNTTMDEVDPWLSEDGHRLYFSRTGDVPITEWGIFHAYR